MSKFKALSITYKILVLVLAFGLPAFFWVACGFCMANIWGWNVALSVILACVGGILTVIGFTKLLKLW